MVAVLVLVLLIGIVIGLKLHDVVQSAASTVKTTVTYSNMTPEQEKKAQELLDAAEKRLDEAQQRMDETFKRADEVFKNMGSRKK